jgi:hypothetical protein
LRRADSSRPDGGKSGANACPAGLFLTIHLSYPNPVAFMDIIHARVFVRLQVATHMAGVVRTLLLLPWLKAVVLPSRNGRVKPRKSLFKAGFLLAVMVLRLCLAAGTTDTSLQQMPELEQRVT